MALWDNSQGKQGFSKDDGNDAERLFYEDSAEKAKIGRARFAKHPHKGGRRARFPSDMLRGKEKREYMKAGELTMQDLKKPITYAEFKKLSDANQKMQLTIYGNAYGFTSVAISTVLGCSQNAAYSLVKKAGLLEQFRQKRKEATPEKKKQQKRALELATAKAENVPAMAGSAVNPETNIQEPEAPEMEASSPCESLDMRTSGTGALVKMSVAAFLEQIADSDCCTVHLVLTKP